MSGGFVSGYHPKERKANHCRKVKTVLMSAKASSYRFILALILALAVTFVWSAAAYAVTPEDVQYGPPTSSVGDTTGTDGSGSDGPGTGEAGLEGLGSAGYAGGPQGSVGEVADAGSSESVALVGAAPETGIDPSSGSIGLTGLLPETGGPLLSLVALGLTALIGTGLTLLRYRPKND